MRTSDIVVRNPNGLHLRVAGCVAKIVGEHKADVRIECPSNCRHANGCSVIDMLLLEARRGSSLKVQADGPDEEIVIKRLREAFSDGTGI
jgi:phosphotransferase system HPr (HPr) family protein